MAILPGVCRLIPETANVCNFLEADTLKGYQYFSEPPVDPRNVSSSDFVSALCLFPLLCFLHIRFHRAVCLPHGVWSLPVVFLPLTNTPGTDTFGFLLYLGYCFIVGPTRQYLFHHEYCSRVHPSRQVASWVNHSPGAPPEQRLLHLACCSRGYFSQTTIPNFNHWSPHH